MRRYLVVTITAIILCSGARLALATDGYFQTGYGQKVIAMGGASDGLAIGAMSGANNPASIAFFWQIYRGGRQLVCSPSKCGTDGQCLRAQWFGN